MTTLESIVERYREQELLSTRILKHLMILSATLTSIIIVGYHFGTFDQVIHLPFLKARLDPTLYPGDPFIALRLNQFSFFWFFFMPFLKAGVLEITLFIVHIFATYLTFWAIWSLSFTLFQSTRVSALSVLVFVFPHVSFAAFPVIEFSLLNRTFVLPFLLLAIQLYLKKRYLPAYMLLGVMYNLHALSVHFVLSMFLLHGVLEFRQVGLKRLVAGFGLFVVMASPVLFWKTGVSHIDFSLNPELLDIVGRGFLYHIFHIFSPLPYVALVALSSFSSLGLFAIGYRAVEGEKHRTVLIFVLAVLIILGLQVVVSKWLPITILIESQISRAGLFAFIFGYLYFVNYLVNRYQNRETEGSFLPLVSILIVSPAPLFALMAWAADRIKPFKRTWQPYLIVGIVLIYVATLSITTTLGILSPGVHVYARHTPWYETQQWAKENTPKDAIFMTPLNKWWLYESEWRVFSERQTVVTLSELLEVALAPDYLDVWQSRMDDLAPGAVDKLNGDIFNGIRVTGEAYNNLSTTQIEQLSCKYNVSYVVVEKPFLHELTKVYENSRFIIYDLTSQSCP